LLCRDPLDPNVTNYYTVNCAIYEKISNCFFLNIAMTANKMLVRFTVAVGNYKLRSEL